MRCYAGIGSRETPDDILLVMQAIAMQLALRGFALCSGGAIGADQAFEHGCDMVRGYKYIYRAEDATVWAMEHASRYHPAWDRCSDYAKKLHARNSLIMLGRRLNEPVEFVVCWTKGGAVAGGTGQALRIAVDPGIPIQVFNLALVQQSAIWEWLDA